MSTHAILASDELIEPSEAAKLAGLTTKTLLRYHMAGYLPAVALPSGRHRYRRADIEALTAVRETSGAA